MPVDAETLHKLHLKRLSLGLFKKAAPQNYKALSQNILGLNFINPVGLAAGYDKYAQAVPAFERLGFGFAELGSVTPLEQPGNPRPRMHCLKADKAMINHMGLNNPGFDAFSERVQTHRASLKYMPVFVNLAKGKAQEDTAADYLAGLERFEKHADAIVLNLSCPNVTGFKNMQDIEIAGPVLGKVRNLRAEKNLKTPVLVKIGPDLAADDLEAFVNLITEAGIEGIVATNLTHARPESLKTRPLPEKGGLSGPPMRAQATKTIAEIYRLTQGKLVIIGVGGIAGAQDAYDKIRAGASLIELYTGLVYHGMGLAAEIASGLDALLKRDGFAHISEAVGADVREKREAA